MSFLTKLLALVATCAVGVAQAQTREDAERRAMRVYSYLTGTIPSQAKLQRLTDLMEKDPRTAAFSVLQEEQPYRNLIGRFISLFDEDGSEARDFSDGPATLVAMAQQNVDWRKILDSDLVAVGSDPSLPPYSVLGVGQNNMDPNGHYKAFMSQNRPLSELVLKKQSELVPFLTEDVASGIISTRAFGLAYLLDGTNRAAFRHLMMKFTTCQDMELHKDTSLTEKYISCDVTRAPANQPSLFHEECRGCHSGMDPMRNAFAYWDFDANAGLRYTPGKVDPKHNQCQADAIGNRVADDRWRNMWALDGQNRVHGWNGAIEGKGVRTLAKHLAESDAFPRCWTEHLLSWICNRPKSDSVEYKTAVNVLANMFRNDGYRFRNHMARVVLACTEQ
jgi:hypothetical protein